MADYLNFGSVITTIWDMGIGQAICPDVKQRDSILSTLSLKR